MTCNAIIDVPVGVVVDEADDLCFRVESSCSRLIDYVEP